MIDPLQAAVDALREATDGEPSAIGRYTRARVLSSVRQQKRRRVLNVAFGIPLAAILVGTGAWAASGERLPRLVQRVSVALGLRQAPTLPVPLMIPKKTGLKSATSAAASATTDDVRESAEDGAASVEPNDPAVAASEPSSARNPIDVVRPPPTVPSASASATPKTVPRESPMTEEELRLYERAHRAHFADKDATLALSAWNDYLRAMPRGRFAVEAHYNRALCLARLGRNEEASAALRPFAQGAFGSYRKAEAAALLEQLSVSAPR